ncbi:hypothetical protein EYC80_006331 [Monilinia laxa]|uniref:Uncharacterized protein n=1 Tax=Monilinia laxa TaxID=61186 RepID=A0A5N6JRM4_MONLA|nr:hypothetical protein EYC80_006331 [Monilinia laxa]
MLIEVKISYSVAVLLCKKTKEEEEEGRAFPIFVREIEKRNPQIWCALPIIYLDATRTTDWSSLFDGHWSAYC